VIERPDTSELCVYLDGIIIYYSRHLVAGHVESAGVAEAVEILRRHMLLDDLADV
jgi:hypothetical protein